MSVSIVPQTVPSPISKGQRAMSPSYSIPLAPSRAQSPTPPNKVGSFHGAHNFGISHSTFIDMYGGDKSNMKLDELKLNLRMSNIKGSTYDEVPRERRNEVRFHEVPNDILAILKNYEAFKELYFFTTSHKDVLSQFGIALLRLFNEAAFPGIRLVAHILFYEIPISEKADIVSTRPNVSRRWVTTLAYQLMQSIPELQTPMLEALCVEPNLPQCNPDYQLRRLVLEPLRVAANRGKLPRDETMLLFLDCIDCSMDPSLMASDIAGFMEDLQTIKGLKFRILVTGSRNKDVLGTLSEAHVVVSDLHPLKRIASPRTRFHWVPRLSVLKRRLILDMFIAGSLGGATAYLGLHSENSELVGCLLGGMLIGIIYEAAVASLFIYYYLTLTFYRPWDVHGRNEEVKKAVLEHCSQVVANWGNKSSSEGEKRNTQQMIASGGSAARGKGDKLAIGDSEKSKANNQSSVVGDRKPKLLGAPPATVREVSEEPENVREESQEPGYNDDEEAEAQEEVEEDEDEESESNNSDENEEVRDSEADMSDEEWSALFYDRNSPPVSGTDKARRLRAKSPISHEQGGRLDHL